MSRTALHRLIPLLCIFVLAQPSTAQQRGALFIVGGGRQPDELITRFIELAGGPGRARIAVVPMASAAAEQSGDGKVEQLVEFGADAFNLNLSRVQASTDSAAALLNGVTGVWFAGGDQVRLTEVLQGTPVLEAIRARHDGGAVLGGTSAGAAIMSDSMLTGRQVPAGQDTLGYHGDEYRRIARGSIEIVPGFGFLQDAIIDQHFVERERHNRLLSVVLERPAMIGAGIAEGTALEVAPDGRWSVHGRGAVIIYDAREASITGPASTSPGAAGIRMHVLPAGATYDPATGSARLETTVH